MSPIAARVLAGFLALAAVAGASAAAEAQLEEWLRRLPQGGSRLPAPLEGLPDAKVGAALRQALEVATTTAVTTTGRLDGYFANQAIRILMPENLRSLEHGLRAVGQGERVDEFILSMNRAAERAAPAARTIFLDAIGAMTFADVQRIFAGGDTAATDYFKTTTTDQLTAAFQPYVAQALGEVGTTRLYRDLTAQAQLVPFLKLESLDLDRHVVGKALDGLFHVVADEERKIRTQPAARVTELLQEVFGRR